MKPIAVIGRYFKELNTALENAKDGYCVIKCDGGYLVVKETYLDRATVDKIKQKYNL